MKLRALTVALVLTAMTALPARAVPVLVGSWIVGATGAPEWDAGGENGPLAYTAQEAAALLFGGIAANYMISISADPNAVTHTAWYDQIGSGLGIFAEDLNRKYLGLYYGPLTDPWDPETSAISSYVRDNASDNVFYVNYAFIDVTSTPIPASMPLFLTGAGVLGFFLRKRARNQRG